MVCTSYLRVYLPESSFVAADAERWQDADDERVDAPLSRRWLITREIPEPESAALDGAFVRELDGTTFVCPWRTRLRMLAGLLAFRNSVPDEVADAFVPDAEAHRAARELAELSDAEPEVRSHILHANWHVPLRWFGAFTDDERILTEDRDGLRVRYETRLSAARPRLRRCVDVLEESALDDSVVEAVRELLEWLDDFDGDGLLELDYASVSRVFEPDELVDDHSAGDIQTCLDALATGDILRAGRLFTSLTDRWTEARAHEVVN